MAVFRTREGRVYETTAKRFVHFYHQEAESSYADGGYVVYDLGRMLREVTKRKGVVLGAGDTPQKAWMDAARKLEARLAAGGYR